MNKTIWVKPYLKPFNLFLMITLNLALSFFSYAKKVETSSLFIHLSDAMAEVKKGDITKSQPYLIALTQEFEALPTYQSPAGQAVSLALNSAKKEPNLEHFEQLSKALYAFEKEQNPVDYTQKRQLFEKRVMPVFQTLSQAIQSKDLEAIQNAYKRFNTVWTVNEKVVRETSLGHYGQIETAMTLLRIAMLSEVVQFNEMEKQAIVLGQSLADFNTGNVLQPQISTASNAPQTLNEGITLLEKSYQALEQNRLAEAKANIMLFIQQWTIFEGEVSTRDSSLYQRVESELPVILVKGNQAENLHQFQQLITALKALNTQQYNMFDAMLVLLREGLEALLIIMALLTTLNVAQQSKAKHWVYIGAGLGLGASVLGAVALQTLFPAISAGKSREILEGAVGIIAVAMMLVVGAWLHSKATVAGWKRFMDKYVHQTLATGSLISMLSLSFLAVFREGAETILFYAGMLPLMSSEDFLSGIGLALLLLAILAVVMAKTSHRLPIPHLFKLMTLLIYVLGFKILGVSIQALQLTQVLPRNVIVELPNFPFIGFYASWESVIAQAIYLVMIFIVAKIFHR